MHVSNKKIAVERSGVLKISVAGGGGKENYCRRLKYKIWKLRIVKTYFVILHSAKVHFKRYDPIHYVYRLSRILLKKKKK